MGAGLDVLHIEDDFGDAMLLQHALHDADAMDLNLVVVRTLHDAKAKLSKKSFDLIIADLRLPDSRDPLATVSQLRDDHPDAPILVLTGSVGLRFDLLDDDITVLDKTRFFNQRSQAKTKSLVGEVRNAIARGHTAAVGGDEHDALML